MKNHPEIQSEVSPGLPLSIGAPVWACGEWAGQVYPARTPRGDWLHWYSKTFNTVEGNSTFYSLPPLTTFEKWAEQSLPGFEFCFKFPRQITHDAQLQQCQATTREFLRRLEVLAKAGRLGPTFLQLGPSFGPKRFDVLRSYLRALPREFPWAVEVRHADWFDANHDESAPSDSAPSDSAPSDSAKSNSIGTSNERQLNELLSELNIDKVLFDSRPLFQSPPEDAIETESQARKPKTPVRQTVTARRPMLRIVGRNRVELADRFFEQWAPIVSRWIQDGLKPIVFTHAPDDAKAPELARRFLAALQKHLSHTDLTLPLPGPRVKQLSFFDE